MTNNQAQAYAELAMRKAGIDEETIKRVLGIMHGLFDLLSEEEAEKQAHY